MKVILKRMTAGPHSIMSSGCLHEIVQEVLTNKGERIEFPPGTIGFHGRQLYAEVKSSYLHFPYGRHLEEKCEDAHRLMIAENLKSLAHVMEYVHQ